MSKNIKLRNIRNEYIYSFMWNFIVIFAALIAADTVLHQIGPIGDRTMLLFYAADGVITLLFMYWMEKYSVTISGLYESTVINVLSNIYTFIAVSFVNLLFFFSKEKIIMDAILCVAKIIGVYLTDLILISVRNNPKFRKKPKMLIIGATSKNFYRMKRIKYGVLANYDSWYESIEELNIDEVKAFVDEKFSQYEAICVLDGVNEEEYALLVGKATELNKDLFIVPKMIDVGKTNARLARFDDVLTLYMPEKVLSGIEKFLKRFMDIVLSIVGCAIAVIPMIIIAILIKLTSKGPVFYKQTRYTIGKKEFEIYKFRTMIPDAEKLSGPKFAEKDDPRITPIGKILRACRLDELPQILNILKGDMSVVGPRPERPVFVEQFEKEIENYDYRFEVKAGLTSLSHVYGRYSTYIHDRTYYDLFYITHYSLLLDLKIILLTTKTMLLKSAAEGEDDFKEKTVAQENAEVETVEKNS